MSLSLDALFWARVGTMLVGLAALSLLLFGDEDEANGEMVRFELIDPDHPRRGIARQDDDPTSQHEDRELAPSGEPQREEGTGSKRAHSSIASARGDDRDPN